MQIYWWTHYGPFPPADERELYPQRRAVLLHYLKNKGWTYEQLAQRLDCKKRFVYYVLGEKRIKMNSMAFLRRLAALLEIPLVLFGLDSHYVNAPTEPAWWVRAGYPPFPPGDDGYPHVGKVIAYYRKLRVQTLSDGSIRPWTQEDLGQALDGTTLAMIRRYEQGKAIDSQERRRALMHILGIPAVLLGLDGLQHLSPTDLVGPSLQLPRNFKPDGALLTRYEKAQGTILQQYLTQHGQNLVPEVKQWIAHLEEITPLIEMTKDYCHSIALQIQYHQFLTNVAMERCDPIMSLSSANRALTLAEDIRDTAWQAKVLEIRAIAYKGQGDYVHALEDINDALDLAQTAHPSLLGHIKIDAAVIYAQGAQSDVMKVQAQSFLEQGWNILQKSDLSEDPYHLRFGHDIYHVRSISTYLSLYASRVPTLGKALDAIEKADLVLDPKMKRRRLLFDVFHAQVLFAQKHYAEATEKALVVLTMSEEIKSYRIKQMIGELYQKLAATNYGGSPQVARLKWKLQQWGKG